MDKLEIWIPVIVALIAALPGYIGTFKGHSSRKYIHKALLRSDMFVLTEQCRQKGFRSQQATYHFNELWTVYKKIGGNSYAEEIKENFESIPKEN